MKQVITLSSFATIILFNLTACKKNIEAGITINASGIVFDEVKSKPLSNAKLYLYGANRTFYGIYYSKGPLDSTISDNRGKFSIQFYADGQTVDYGLQLAQLEYGGYVYNDQSNYVIDEASPILKFNYSKNLTNAVVKGRELNYLIVNLKIVTNPFDTFYVRTNALRQATLVKGHSIDTTLTLRFLPGQENIIQYYTESLRDTAGLAVLNSNPNAHMYSVRRSVSDTINASMTDTLFVSKTISNSLSMPRQ